MAVFRKGKKKWEHVGFYIGITPKYGHTIIEARDKKSDKNGFKWDIKDLTWLS